MQFDPNNKVVKLCAEGMQAEAEGKKEEAHSLFQQAWDIASDDFEAFTAAHYLARNQKDLNDVLKWNLEALNRANKIKDDDVGTHFPSLHLNIGKSYENLGDIKSANENYAMAADCSSFLPSGKYSDMIRMGIAGGLTRTGTIKFSNAALDELIDQWCADRNLKPLGLVLPAYNSNLGTENDLNKLISALSYLSATQCLGQDEQVKVDEVIKELSSGVE